LLPGKRELLRTDLRPYLQRYLENRYECVSSSSYDTYPPPHMQRYLENRYECVCVYIDLAPPAQHSGGRGAGGGGGWEGEEEGEGEEDIYVCVCECVNI
jgi:hypothetical protein